MYVRNFKLNGKMIFKIIFVILTILIFIMFAIGVINIINSNERITSKSEGVPQSEINTISAANYTNVLKTANETCSSLYISDPFKKKKEKDSIFSTHPSIANRIEKLRNIK